ncbi:MAG: DUF4064 domain-containing protein, partial [Clostridia bacterium]|nr:DUF4064 domain-containing protein [Clostridia bacterium]
MRKTSFGLGLAGSILAFVIAGIMLIFAIGLTVMNHVDWDDMGSHMDDVEITIDGEKFEFDMDDDEFVFEGNKGFRGEMRGGFRGFPNMFARVLSGWLWFAVAALIVGGVLGIIGTVITKKRRSVAAGVLLLVSAVLCAFSLYGMSASALLIPSGVLALIKDKNEKREI